MDPPPAVPLPHPVHGSSPRGKCGIRTASPSLRCVGTVLQGLQGGGRPLGVGASHPAIQVAMIPCMEANTVRIRNLDHLQCLKYVPTP
uniref:Uncharacterized protein n=1 Tax=Arundo donax TaxID=35708 RepID=A0A0A9ET67_ARUDO